MFKTKNGQRLLGVFLLLLGGGFTAYTWYTALYEGWTYQKGVPIFPISMVFGLGAILFPIDVAELEAKYGAGNWNMLEDVPAIWGVIPILALGAAFANWYTLSRVLAGP
jgi:hypothetical protein